MEMGLIEIIVLIIVNGVVDCTLVAYFAGRRSKKALVDWLMSGDEEQQRAVAAIIGLAIVTPIKTGKKVADEDGKEHDEVIPLFKYMGRELSNALLYKLKAARGGSLSAAGKDAMDELGGPSLLGSLGPRKGQTSMEWIMEQAAPRLMPIIEKKVAEALEKKPY
jgi:hypothetical protein